MTVDISGLDKADVLHALVTSGSPMGMGFLQARPFSIEEARQWVEQRKVHDADTGFMSHSDELYFDYVTGVPLKVNITNDTFDEWGYDRDQGEGAAEAAIRALRERLAN